jgi:hypothetical protein
MPFPATSPGEAPGECRLNWNCGREKSGVASEDPSLVGCGWKGSVRMIERWDTMSRTPFPDEPSLPLASAD